MKQIAARLKKAMSHPLAKGSAIVFVGTMVANIGSYLYHLVVGRMLGPSAYGELAALLSLAYICNVFTVLLQTVVTKFVAERMARNAVSDVRSLVFRLTEILAVAGAVVLVVLLFVAPSVANFLHTGDTVVIYLLFVGIMFTFLGMVYSSVLQGMQRFVEGMVLLNANSFLRLLSGIAVASFGVTATLGANSAAIIIASLIALWPIRQIMFTKEKTSEFAVAPLFRTSITTLLVLIGINVINTQDVVIAKHFLPDIAAGWYGALSIMGKIIFFASSSIVYVLLPIVSDRVARGTGARKLVYASVAIVAVLSFGVTAGFFLFPQFALGMLYGSAFIAAAPYLGLFGIYSSLYTIAYTLVISLLGQGKTGIWGPLIAIAFIQDVCISLFHTGITSVILVNIAISAALVTTLLLYYRHAVKGY